MRLRDRTQLSELILLASSASTPMWCMPSRRTTTRWKCARWKLFLFKPRTRSAVVGRARVGRASRHTFSGWSGWQRSLPPARGETTSFAMQAGRQIRVMVAPDVVDDIEAQVLARDIAKQIEEELTYPGQIKVTVVRESRATETAR